MIVPNKFYSYGETVLKHIPIIMEQRELGHIRLKELYRGSRKSFRSIEEFLLTLDVLYVLGYIDLNLETEVISYAT